MLVLIILHSLQGSMTSGPAQVVALRHSCISAAKTLQYQTRNCSSGTTYRPAARVKLNKGYGVHCQPVGWLQPERV